MINEKIANRRHMLLSYSLNAHVELVYPQEGEVFISNSTIEIEWFPTVAHNTEDWDLLISVDGGIMWDMFKYALALNLPEEAEVLKNNFASTETTQP